VPRPPDIAGIIRNLFNIGVYPVYFRRIIMHSLGKMAPAEKMFIPESQFPKIYTRARIYVAIYATTIGLAIYTRSILPLLLVGLTNLFGSWLMLVYGLTQHAGLAENVLDHRLNCRTVYMNFINRFLYWNMNYHVEHHMFPLVPYHALPRLHEAVKADMPKPYPSLLAAWREIMPAIFHQTKDPAWHVKRVLPEAKARLNEGTYLSEARPDQEGWLEVCPAADLARAEVIRFENRQKTYVLIRDEEGKLYAMDGICTHGNTHLADGLVKGKIIECPKHNGRFNLEDGSPARAPVCRGLATYPVKEHDGRLFLNVTRPGGAGLRAQKILHLRVVSNRSVATFIKELQLEPLDGSEPIEFTPGDYIQLDIPPYENIRFREFDIPEPYAAVWERQHVFDLVASNPVAGRRNNYSLASNRQLERVLRFNVRIATPPPGQACPPGIGSSYVFNLKPSDTVTAIGPFGDFHIKPTLREMVYIGRGSGMAPLRAHLSHLFETEHTHRKVSFWYGARSRQELFYQDYFQQIAATHPNFRFQVALSNPQPEDNWTGLTGFIHEAVLQQYLGNHPDPASVEYYLCGPPMMIKAVKKMLAELGVPPTQIAFDEF